MHSCPCVLSNYKPHLLNDRFSICGSNVQAGKRAAVVPSFSIMCRLSSKTGDSRGKKEAVVTKVLMHVGMKGARCTRHHDRDADKETHPLMQK